MKKETKKIPYVDYECKVGERVQWVNLKKEKFEGILEKMDENCVATIKMDDGSEMEVQC